MTKFSTIASLAGLAAQLVSAGSPVVRYFFFSPHTFSTRRSLFRSIKHKTPTLILTESDEQFKHWLNTTDANITFLGTSREELLKRQSIVVTYCDKRIDDLCGGNCFTYGGPAACLDAPGTACIRANGNVGFCDREGCGHSCNQLSSCGTLLGDGFCDTPGTQSILIGN